MKDMMEPVTMGWDRKEKIFLQPKQQNKNSIAMKKINLFLIPPGNIFLDPKARKISLLLPTQCEVI